MTRTGTGANTHARTSDTGPVESFSSVGSQVVPFGHEVSVQQRSTQMPRVASQMPPRHSEEVAHACPDTFVAAPDATQDGMMD